MTEEHLITFSSLQNSLVMSYSFYHCKAKQEEGKEALVNSSPFLSKLSRRLLKLLVGKGFSVSPLVFYAKTKLGFNCCEMELVGVHLFFD